MDALLAAVRPVLLLVAIWATFFLTNLAPPENRAVVTALALSGYLAGYAIYPVIVVLGSGAVAATTKQRQITAISVVLFVLLMLSRPYDLSPRDRISSVLAIAALISIWHSFIVALTAAEARKQFDNVPREWALWVAALLFPFLGVLYVHRRYRLLAVNGKAA